MDAQVPRLVCKSIHYIYIYIYFFCGACSSWLLLYLLLLFLFHVVVILVGCNCCRSRFNVHPRRPFRSLPFSPTSFPSLYPLFPNDSSCRVSLNEMRASLPFVGWHRAARPRSRYDRGVDRVGRVLAARSHSPGERVIAIVESTATFKRQESVGGGGGRRAER